MPINRRDLLKTAIGAVPAIAASGYSVTSLHQMLSGEQRTVASLLEKYRQDRIDARRTYLDHHNFKGWHREIHTFFKKNLIGLSVPVSGPIVELGVYKGESARLLKKIFGRKRYVGVDAHPYKNIQGVIQADIRDFADLPQKAAFIWNDISTWDGSPRSRLAAFHWSVRNLAPGAIYIDEGAEQIPVDLDYSGFELLHKGHKYTVFRKV